MAATNSLVLLEELTALNRESEWVEFKANNQDPQLVGKLISGLSNAAALHQRRHGYLVWGVQDEDHAIVGTDFSPRDKKVGNQELENWLCTQLLPRIHFSIHEIDVGAKKCVIFEIQPARYRPTAFKGREWIRIGSYLKPLSEHPEQERILWRSFDRESFESGVSTNAFSADEVLSRIDYPSYFHLTGQPLPPTKKTILRRLQEDEIIKAGMNSLFLITNLGAILFARDLGQFGRLGRKAVRVIFYDGSSRVDRSNEIDGRKGYASGFVGLIGFIRDRLPASEQIREALRTEVPMYPEIAVRELVANALIHQDFDASGTGPMVEIFSDRMEITNPGTPLIDPRRFLDLPPKSRNDKLASFMRRIGMCEERGSGIDKVFASVEIYQLPPPDFEIKGESTRVTLFAPRSFRNMSKAERVRACYQHASPQYVKAQHMTNSSLRSRFSIATKNYATASRIIADTIEAGLIKHHDPSSKSKKHAKYDPFWA